MPAKPTVIHRYLAHFAPWLVRRHEHRHDGGEAGYQQHYRVGRARPALQFFVGCDELLRILVLHQAEAGEQASEGQDFGRQEQPHTDLAGIELLLHGGEMMLMMRIMLTAVAVRILMDINRGCAHTCVTVLWR